LVAVLSTLPVAASNAPIPAPFWAADIHEHAAVIHQRRTGGSEEAFGRLELLPRIYAPEALAGGEIERSKDPPPRTCKFFRLNGRRGARSLIEAKIIAIIGGIPSRPDALSLSLPATPGSPAFRADGTRCPPARHDRCAKPWPTSTFHRIWMIPGFG